MTDRGVPIVDGAVACPFVAFEDDRESRASSPDQRHRCFAEVRPAPRAQAHQDAYCLSSAFPMCPTFQDWARREAARVQEETRPNDAFGDLPARRNPQRGWAAPPPWTGAGGQQRRPDDDDDPDYLLGGGIAGGGLAGSLAHQIAMDAAPSAPASGRLPLDQPARFDRAAASEPSFEPAHESSSERAAPPMGHRDDNDDGWPLRPAPRDRDLPARPPLAARGADRSRAFDDDDVGDEGDERSAAELDDGAQPLPPDLARWARPEARVSPPGAPGGRDVAPARPRPPYDQEDVDSDDVEAFDDPRQAGRLTPRPPQQGGIGRVSSLLPGDHRPKVGDTRPRRRTAEPLAPPWERPRRYEAYPTLRTRIGLPPVPRVGLLAIALLLAAVGLFFLPTLLGLGSPAGSPAPSGSVGPSAGPSLSAGPTVPAAPTPRTYEVQPGDTMSKIAGKLGVPLADLVAANKDKFPNPDKIAIGDILIVPSPPPSGFTDPRTAAPVASPTRAPATRTPAPTRR